jgi:glycosyltransferase involved in cell wall biosynthesis
MAMNVEAAQGSLLLEVPVPFRVVDGQVLMELQAYQGLIRWLENFASVSLCAPVKPESEIPPSVSWAPLTDMLAGGRLEVHLLPWGYHPRAHFQEIRTVRAKFRQLIPRHRYLCFSNLGVFGAWGRVAAEEAHKLKKPYAIWLDWVLHEMPVKQESNPLKMLWRRLELTALKWTSFRDLRRSALGLFHGRSVYDSYAPLVRVPRLVHDIHLSEKDIISDAALEARLSRAPDKLSILYVGRVHPMKGPLFWIECIEQLIRNPTPGCPPVEATWVGDGPMLEEARSMVAARGLSGSISFRGAETDRGKILEIFRGADLFVFCHTTPESPRCLIEALMSGVPILGFDSPYARDLISEGGGATVPVGDIQGLAGLIATHTNEDKRREISAAALRAGRRFSEEAVFRHRAELIKEHL